MAVGMQPDKGLQDDEVIWKISVMSPIWANEKPNFSLSSG